MSNIEILHIKYNTDWRQASKQIKAYYLSSPKECLVKSEKTH